MIINNGPLGKARSKQEPLYDYTGTADPLYSTTRADGTIDWELVLRTSGTLTFTRVVDKVDIFLVGGGASGGAAQREGGGVRGGAGGKGGQCVTYRGVDSGNGSNITIGGSGQSTIAFNRTAVGGGGASGGTGAYCNVSPIRGEYGTDADDGTTAFGGETTLFQNGHKYGPGGGSGSAQAENSSTLVNRTGGAAGHDNGAAGGNTDDHTRGWPAAENTGAGGGGGSGFKSLVYGEEYDLSEGGAGGSGIVIIRNAR